MKIGFLSQVAVKQFGEWFPDEDLPEGYASEIFIPLIKKYLECGHEVVVCTTNHHSHISRTYQNNNLTIFVAGTLIKPKIRAINGFRYEIHEMVHFFKKILAMSIMPIGHMSLQRRQLK